MKVEHEHRFPFFEQMMLKGWFGPWWMMAAVAALKKTTDDTQDAP